MQWRDVLFCHWRVPPDRVAPTLPDGIELDTYDGSAWLGVVPFRMADIRPRGFPIGRSFHELNLRTYVTVDGRPGVYFYNLDADDRLGVAVARRLFKLPYYRARMQVRSGAGRTHFRSRRVHRGAPPAPFDASWETEGTPRPVRPDTLESFLVERYRFYVADESGGVYHARIDHPTWELQRADLDVRRNGLFAAAGMEPPESEPLVHASPGTDVTAGRVRRIRSGEGASD